MKNSAQIQPTAYPVWVFIVVMIVLGVVHKALAAEVAPDMSQLLQRKMDSIQIVAEKIARQQQHSEQLRSRLVSERETYAGEIVAEMRRIRASSLKQALVSPRITYNLKLVGRLDAVLNALSARIAFYDAGAHRLHYLLAKAGDDLKLVRTFTVSSADHLVAEIDGAIDRYHLAATAPLFDVQKIALPETEAVWKAVTGIK